LWKRKNKAYIVTAVDRSTDTIVGFAVCAERTLEILQSVIDSAIKAENYYTDGFLMRSGFELLGQSPNAERQI
jgi:IS1 family transposase